jgi:hypothetical protein
LIAQLSRSALRRGGSDDTGARRARKTGMLQR